jgi:PAS domain S-box-containing protein
MKMGTGFFAKYIHPDDLKKLYLIYKRFAKANDNEILDYEYRIMNSKNEWRWMHSYDVVFKRSADGMAIQMLGSAQDVTERKKLEQELTRYSGHLEELVDNRTRELKLTNERLKQEIQERARAEKSIIEAEEKFRSLVEHSLAGIYILQDSKYVYVNPRFEEIFGYSKDEMGTFDPGNLISEDDKEQVHAAVAGLFDKSSLSVKYTYKAIRKDKRIIHVEVRAARIDYEGKQALIGTLQDITERKQSEDEIRKQQEFLRTVIDLSPNLIFAKDWEGRFTLANKAVAEIYGTSTEELIGKTDADFNANTEEVKQFIESDREVISRMKAKAVPEEMVSNTKTGETKWFQTIKIPLISGTGQKQVLGVSSDITARKLAEELTKKSLKEKELLLQEIHHRVKNNLQIIVSLLKLQAKYIYDERDLEIFNNSRSRVETMSLIHEKLYKSRDISRIDFESYIKDLASYLIKAYKVHQENIELTVRASDIYLGIDTAIPCGLIINELIINTLKYAFPEGKKGKICISVEQSNDEVQLTVADDGIGLPQNFNIKESDSLGLQLVDTLIRQLNGSVHVDNSEGTSYKIRFTEEKYKERI